MKSTRLTSSLTAALPLLALLASGCSSSSKDGPPKAPGTGDSESGVNVTIAPRAATLGPSGTQAFSATVVGTTNVSVNWTAPDPGGGTVSSTGLYTAPGSTGTYRVVVTSAGDPTKSATAFVTVTTPTTFGGVTFPWPVFDGMVPDVPTSTTGKTVYVDAVNGNDARDGLTFATSKKTISSALGIMAAGDTMLLAGGLYRERPNFDALTGTAAKPITIASYGRGTGRPIIDGGVKPNTWTKYTAQGQTRVWQTSTSGLADFTSASVRGVYVNSGTSEDALKEVYHGQLDSYGGTMPPTQTQANITDSSGNWYYDTGTKTLYADFGSTLGTGDPNLADVSLVVSAHEPLITLTGGAKYLSFVGLAMRCGSWHAIYSEAGRITIDRCDLKFNGGGGAALEGSTGYNTVTRTRIWMNVLDNWPRFNNHNSGGGWPGGLSFDSQSNTLSEGNVIYRNGGEGQVFYDTLSGHTGVNNLSRHNVVFDNFSVNFYVDNIQGVTIEECFGFNHPKDLSTTFPGLPSNYDDPGRRLVPILLSLADEPSSSWNGSANLNNITVRNNIFAGSKHQFLDYDDGTGGHGLKSCSITNNTFIQTDPEVADDEAFGWRHMADSDHSANSVIENNVFVTNQAVDRFADILIGGTTYTGILLDYNCYSGPGVFDSAATDGLSLAAWRSAISPWDAHSRNVDAQLTSVAEFTATYQTKLVYDWSKAKPLAGSPVTGAGLDLSASYARDFTGATRPAGAFDLGAIVAP
jgi:hypothetical protein